MNETIKEKQQTNNNQLKTEHTNYILKTTKPISSTPSLRVDRFVGSGLWPVVFGRRFSGRSVVGHEDDWRKFLWSLSCSDLEELSKIRKEVYFAKFPSRTNKPMLSRNIYRVFNGQDLIDFFSCIRPNEVKMGLAFFLQLTGGFRIGEVSPIKVKDVDFRRGVISLVTEKANVYSDQPMPSVTLEVLQEWIEHNKGGVELGGYVFFSRNLFKTRDYVSKDAFRNYFHAFRKRSNLCSTYGMRNDLNNPKHKENHQLFKLTSHSFRRSYLTALYQDCKKKELVSVLARHLKRDVTDQYIYFTHEEQLELVNRVFNREPFITIARDLIEKIRTQKEESCGSNETNLPHS